MSARIKSRQCKALARIVSGSAACFAVALIGTPPWTRSGSADAAEPPEEMTVTGRYPGPPLWKVTHGDNELWIFGTLAAVPRDITWGSLAVERVIDRADEVLGPPGISAWTSNPFR